jgi:uncharacterized membrane protein (DUF485 family)
MPARRVVAQAAVQTATSRRRHHDVPNKGCVMGTMNSAVGGDRYAAVHDSARFDALRRRSNTLTLWTTVTFFGFWFLTIGLAAFARDFFNQGLVGPLNVGLLFMFLSSFSVVVTTAVYMRLARTRLDPLSEQIRADLEGDLG